MSVQKTRTTRGGAGVLAAALLLLVPTPGSGQELPGARELVDRYVEAIGGRDGILSRTFIRSTGRFELPAMGVSGTLEVYQGHPGRNAVLVSIPGIGEIRSGFDGTVGWSLDPLQGPRIMEGRELAQTREEARFESTLRDPSLVASMETIERTEMNGEECWRVRLTWQSGRETFDYYSVASGLLVASSSTQESPMGSIQVTSLLSDYQEFDGFRFPTRMRQQMMGQEQVLIIDQVEFPPLDETVFDLPSEIRALAGG